MIEKMYFLFIYFYHRCLWTGHSTPPFFYTLPPFKKIKMLMFFYIHFHGLEICKTAIICRLLNASWSRIYIYYINPWSWCISVDWCNQKTAFLYTYQSTDAIRKRHIIAVLHISKPWKWKKKHQIIFFKRG